MKIFLSGKLDMTTSDKLNKNFSDKDLTLDFAEVEYISSVGLTEILKLRKKIQDADGTFEIENLRENVAEVFEMTDALNLQEVDEKNFYTLRPIQRWMFDTNLKQAKCTMMNIGLLYRLDYGLDLEKFCRAVEAMTKNHDIFGLRFIFNPQTFELCQTFVEERAELFVEKISTEDLNLRLKNILQPYKLINSPLYRIKFFETPTAKYIFFDFHHAVIDGFSISVLMAHETKARYLGRNPKPSNYGYRELIEEENSLPPEHLETARLYWQNLYQKFNPEVHLIKSNGTGKFAFGNIKNEIPNLPVEFLRGNDFSEEAFFILAALLTTAKITGRKDAFISWVHNGRDTMKKSRVIGILLDQLPLYWNFSADEKISVECKKIFELQNDQLTKKAGLDLMYERGVQDILPCFIFQREMYVAPIIEGDKTLELIDLPPQNNSVAVPENGIDVEIDSDGEKYLIDLEFDTGIFSTDTMNNFVEIYFEVIQQMKVEGMTTHKILK